jgi:hypothetical protein
MSQLIALGNVVLNLDQIVCLDIDPVPNRPDLRKVRILGHGSQPLTEVFVAAQVEAALLNLVQATVRFPGSDAAE